MNLEQVSSLNIEQSRLLQQKDIHYLIREAFPPSVENSIPNKDRWGLQQMDAGGWKETHYRKLVNTITFNLPPLSSSANSEFSIRDFSQKTQFSWDVDIVYHQDDV